WDPRLGSPTLASFPAPTRVGSLPRGIRRPSVITLQGFIEDDRSRIPERVSVPNAIVLRIHLARGSLARRGGRPQLDTNTTHTRREILRGIGGAAAVAAFAPRLLLARAGEPIVLGSGAHVYEWDREWPKFPSGVGFGSTHGTVIVDAAQRVYCSTDTEN